MNHSQVDRLNKILHPDVATSASNNLIVELAANHISMLLQSRSAERYYQEGIIALEDLQAAQHRADHAEDDLTDALQQRGLI